MENFYEIMTENGSVTINVNQIAYYEQDSNGTKIVLNIKDHEKKQVSFISKTSYQNTKDTLGILQNN